MGLDWGRAVSSIRARARLAYERCQDALASRYDGRTLLTSVAATCFISVLLSSFFAGARPGTVLYAGSTMSTGVTAVHTRDGPSRLFIPLSPPAHRIRRPRARLHKWRPLRSPRTGPYVPLDPSLVQRYNLLEHLFVPLCPTPSEHRLWDPGWRRGGGGLGRSGEGGGRCRAGRPAGSDREREPRRPKGACTSRNGDRGARLGTFGARSPCPVLEHPNATCGMRAAC